MKTSYSLIPLLSISFFISSINHLKKNEFIEKKVATVCVAPVSNHFTIEHKEDGLLNTFSTPYSTSKEEQVTTLSNGRPNETISHKNTKIITLKKATTHPPKKEESNNTELNTPQSTTAMLGSSYNLLSDQYNKLQSVLKKYKKIEKENTWENITIPRPYKDLRPDATSPTIGQIRNRLFVMGDLSKDSKNDFYDQDLMDGVMKYKVRNGLTPNYIISEDNINEMNITVSDRIKTLMLNMDRCQKIAQKLVTEKQYVIINIPSFELMYVKNNKIALGSKIFVGEEMTQTPLLDGSIEKIVFSPYWTVPQSILENELKIKMASDKNYLTDHNMELVKGQVRQKPGADNSLGLVKFVFPNPDDIYMHDTPSKSLFNFEVRTFSHGCINVEKAKELAITMLQDYPQWTSDKITKAMDGKVETEVKLSNKVPIYICYFTTWVNDDGQIGFYQDIYNLDTTTNVNTFVAPEALTLKQ